MEYLTGIVTLQAIFSLYWTPYCHWYTGTIGEAVKEVEMTLVAVCFGRPDDEILSKLGCNINDKIAAEQFQFVHDTS
jgi:hypothetical protein